MILKNSTIYNYIALINGQQYELKRSQEISFNCTENTKVQLISTEKPSVHIDWLDVIILQFLIGSSTITRIYADYAFDIIDPSVDIIELKENSWNIRTTIYIRSIYADANITNECYSLPSLEKVKKKHKRLHRYITSAWPIGLAEIIACFLTDSPYLFILLFVFWLLIFELPSLKERKRFKQVMKTDEINTKLCEYAEKRRIDPLLFTDDTSKTYKIVSKIMDKMFKFEDDK